MCGIAVLVITEKFPARSLRSPLMSPAFGSLAVCSEPFGSSGGEGRGVTTCRQNEAGCNLSVFKAELLQ